MVRFVPLVALSALACRTPPTPPNVIVVVLDTLRADRLAAYGNTEGLMPNLEELTKDSLVFDHAYAQSTETMFSFGSFFTGRYPSEIGPSTYEWRVPEDMPVLPEVLGTYGYATGAFVAGGHLIPSFGFDRGFDPYVCAQRNFASLGATRDSALGWMAETREPFFALVHGYDMHARYWKPSPLGTPLPPEGLARTLTLLAKGSDMIVGDLATPEGCLPILANGNTSVRLDEIDPTDPNQLSCMEAQLVVDEESLHAVRGAYDGAARWVDAQLGLLLAGLEEQGRLDDSWIFVLSDHGESLGEDGGFGHRHTISDDVVRVPLIVRPPGGTTARRVGGIVELTDVTATILAIAGAASPAHLRGSSLLAVVDGAERTERRLALTESWAQAMRITSDRGTHLTFEGVGWDNPTWASLLAWAPAKGPSLRRSDVSDEAELERLRGEMIAFRNGLEPPPASSAIRDPRYKEALKKGGYWSP
jgi:arylsulfatase A-like enzyme